MIKTSIIWMSFLNNEIWTFVKRKSRFRKEPALPFNALHLLNLHKIIHPFVHRLNRLIERRENGMIRVVTSIPDSLDL